MTRPSTPWRIAGMVLLATVGGYVITALATTLWTLLLTRSQLSPRAHAVMATGLLSFMLYAAVIVRIFAVDSGRRACLESGAALLVLGAGCLVLGGWP